MYSPIYDRSIVAEGDPWLKNSFEHSDSHTVMNVNAGTAGQFW